MNFLSKVPLKLVWVVIILSATRASAEMPATIDVSDGTVLLTVHAEGAQIYECKPVPVEKSSSQVGAPTWQFREPIATLVVDGKSIGRHYAGPNWDHIDGSGAKGKTAASAPGTAPDDIPWLKLDVVDHRGNGLLSGATTVQRINTRGGVLQGQCESAGVYRSVPYSADYVFLRRGNQR
jgi:Protein of unknown function (DUF3455)